MLESQGGDGVRLHRLQLGRCSVVELTLRGPQLREWFPAVWKTLHPAPVPN